MYMRETVFAEAGVMQIRTRFIHTDALGAGTECCDRVCLGSTHNVVTIDPLVIFHFRMSRLFLCWRDVLRHGVNYRANCNKCNMD